MSNLSWRIGARFPRVFIVISVLLVAAVVRLWGLGDIMTADEDRWVLRSSWYWHEVLQGDFSNTFMTTHPGTTLMWLAGGGITAQAKWQGVDVHLDDSRVKDFYEVAKLPVTLMTALLVGFITYWLTWLLGLKPGWLGGLFLAADPYTVGLSQIIHLDALLALSLLGATVALLAYLKDAGGRHWGLLLSGIMLGFALATKLLPALWLVAFGSLLVLWQGFNSRKRLPQIATALVVWLLVAVVTFLVLCPAFWSPTKLQNENYTEGLTTSYKDDAIAIATDEHIALAASTDPINPQTFYLRTVAARAMPLSLLVSLGLPIALLLAVVSPRQRLVNLQMITKSPIVILLLYALGFLALITFVAKKGDRYALPTLVVLPVIAGAVLAIAWSRLAPRGERHGPKLLVPVVASVVVMAVVLQPLLWRPYAIAYENQIFNVRHRSQEGWGEGLDQAAHWLNNHPLIDANLYIASWYPGVMRTFFKGTTLSLSSRHDERVGFVVVYRNMGGREQDDIATSVLEELRDREPEHVVYIGGKPYVWIYNQVGLAYFTRHTGELVKGHEVGQSLPQVPKNWNSIEIGLATFSSRRNTHDVILHIREDVNATEDLRTVRVNAREIADSNWHRFAFAPLTDNDNKTYYVALSSPDSIAGDAITVKFMTTDTLPGDMFWRRRELRTGERMEQFSQSGDIAYRLPPSED
ncbi:MAG: hypothetical protein WEA04_00545 [Candidatus Andersenbacteria bacterium]